LCLGARIARLDTTIHRNVLPNVTLQKNQTWLAGKSTLNGGFNWKTMSILGIVIVLLFYVKSLRR